MDKKISINWVVAITGASGALYAQRLLALLNPVIAEDSRLAVIFSSNAKSIWEHELGTLNLPEQVIEYQPKNFNAPFASGSCSYDTMIICPASMGVIGRIASGVSDDLITRAADVMLKERRKLILVPRETPYNLIHLNNMAGICSAGGIICPASPSFYSKPMDITDLVDTVVERILTLAGLSVEHYQWGEE